MKRIWTRIHQMLQENFSTPFAKIGILVVILIPLLYGFLYLWAFWDPYGRIQNMPVAFVNLDEGGVKNGEVKNVGKELEDELRSDHNVQWYFTTAEDAQQGLQDKRYYSYILVPADFTRKVLSVESDAPQKAHIILRTREATNGVGSRILNRVGYEVSETLGHKVTEEYFNNVFIESRNAADDIKKAADGAKELNTGLVDAHQGSLDLKDGLDKANDGVRDLANGVYQLYDGSMKLQDGADTAHDGSRKLLTGAKDAYEASGKLGDGVTKLSGGADALNAGIKQSAAGAIALNTGLGTLRDQSGQLSQGVYQGSVLAGGVLTQSKAAAGALGNIGPALTNFINTNPQYANDPDILTIQENLATAGTQMTGVVTNATKLGMVQNAVNSGLSQAVTGINQLYAGSSQLNGGLAQLSAGSQQLADNLKVVQGGQQQLTDGLKKLTNGQRTLTAGLEDLSKGAADLKDGIATAYDGTNTLYQGIGDLREGGQKLADGLGDAQDGSQELYEKLNEGYQNSRDKVETAKTDKEKPVLASPVEFNEELIDPVHTNGAAFAPFFIPLSLWIGAIAIFFVLRPMSNEEAHKKSGLKLVAEILQRYALLVVIAVLQAVLLNAIVLKGLNLQVNHIGLFYQFSILTALLFVTIVMCVDYIFGSAGSFINMVLLMLQLTSSAGTFPLETLPDFFIKINPYMPMTYSVRALRDIISGNNQINVSSEIHLFSTSILILLLVTILVKKLVAEIALAEPGAWNMRLAVENLQRSLGGRQHFALTTGAVPNRSGSGLANRPLNRKLRAHMQQRIEKAKKLPQNLRSRRKTRITNWKEQHNRAQDKKGDPNKE